MSFTYNYYSKLLKTLLDTHVPVTYPKMHSIRKKKFIIRHDIDYGLEFVGVMPEIESELGIISTYFIQTSSIFYNPFSPPQLKQVERLKKLGHRFGLHSDSTSNVRPEHINDFIERELRLLGEICGRLDAISFHHPPKYIVNNDIKIKYINTYDMKDMSGFTYMSDSAGKWSKGNPIRMIRNNTETSFQILIHPFLWNKRNFSFKSLALKSIDEKGREMRNYLAQHCKDF